jgi:branched-chain amino acid transport system permease protein
MNKNSYYGLYFIGAVLLVLPLLLPNSFYLDLVIRMAINAVIVLGLNLLIGFAGQISLGHAGFIGIGAYASAALPSQLGLHPMLALITGAVAAGTLAAMKLQATSTGTPLWPACCVSVSGLLSI